DGVEHRDTPVEGRLAALARRHAGDERGPVLEHRPAVELALEAGDALDDEARVAVDEDAHAATPLAAATAFAAASSRLCAVTKLAASSSSAASAAFVPTILTTIGTSRSCWARASIRPRATSSPRVMPPKMFTRIALTLASSRISRIAAATRSAFAPPPMSRKFAGWPPARFPRCIRGHARPAALHQATLLPLQAV